MDYRKFYRGEETFSTVGVGLGSLGKEPISEEEVERIFRKAIEEGVTYFDLCAGYQFLYAPFGRAIKDCREKIHFPLHYGAVYNQTTGRYEWTRDVERMDQTFQWEMKTLGIDYVDYAFLHCVDTMDDADFMLGEPLQKLLEYKKKGIVKHIGFSGHTPKVAHRLIDSGVIDILMFSINPVYDFCGKGGDGTADERMELYRRCEKEGISIVVMKPFHAGKLLNEADNPFRLALSHSQCIQYVLDRPAVLTTVPGIRSMEQLAEILLYNSASAEERDYSALGQVTAEQTAGSCLYCSHCQPCPMGIDISLVNKYYDLALAGDELAASHYSKLSVKADACVQCGHCDSRCPFGVHQSARMLEIGKYFG